MNAVVDVADAIVAAINAATWSHPFTAVRSYADWNFELTESDAVLHVDVVPITVPEVEQITRFGDVDYQVACQIGIRRKVRTSTQQKRIPVELVDPYVELLQDIGTMLINTPLGVGYDHIANEVIAVYIPEHLTNLNQYTGILQTTFKVTACGDG